MLALKDNSHAVDNSKKTLHIKLPSIELPPFSKEVSVSTINTTIAPILGQLFYIADSFNLKAGLIEQSHWSFKDNSYVLKLKPNLRFHNGREVTSKDLEFSLLRGFYSSKRSFFLAFLNNIQGVESITGKKEFKSGQVKGISILDKRTLKLKLNNPNPFFLHSLARAYFSLVPIEALKKDDYETWKSYPIGAGDYKVSQFNPTVGTLILEKVRELESSPDKIIFYYKKSSHPCDIEIANYENKNEEMKIVSSKRASALTSIYFNYNNSIVNDIRFRQALDLAINRESLTGGIKIYSPVNEFLASHFWGRIESKMAVDIDKAKNLLKEIKGLDLSRTYEVPVFSSLLNNPEYRAKYGAYISDLEMQIKRVGLKIKFVASNKKMSPLDDKDTLFHLFSLGADVVDPIVLFNLLSGENSPMKPHFPMNDKTYNDLLEKAKLETIMEKRVASIKKLSEYLYQNKWMVPLFERKLLVSMDPTRVKSAGLQDGGLTFFVERVTLN